MVKGYLINKLQSQNNNKTSSNTKVNNREYHHIIDSIHIGHSITNNSVHARPILFLGGELVTGGSRDDLRSTLKVGRLDIPIECCHINSSICININPSPEDMVQCIHDTGRRYTSSIGNLIRTAAASPGGLLYTQAQPTSNGIELRNPPNHSPP